LRRPARGETAPQKKVETKGFELGAQGDQAIKENQKAKTKSESRASMMVAKKREVRDFLSWNWAS